MDGRGAIAVGLGTQPNERKRLMRAMTYRTALIIVAVFTAVASADGVNKTSHYARRYEGAYHQGPYYSRSYLQDFDFQEGERPVLFRLRPFRSYGRYSYGNPIEPNLTNGTVESYRFPYRYDWDFRPTQTPLPVPYDSCLNPAARRYESLNLSIEAPAPNQPATVPNSAPTGRSRREAVEQASYSRR